MQQRQESVERVVKVDIGVNPAVISRNTDCLVRHHIGIIFLAILIYAFEEFPTKNVDAYNTEDQPKYYTDQENITNTRDGVKQRAYNDLKTRRTKANCFGLSKPMRSKQLISHTPRKHTEQLLQEC